MSVIESDPAERPGLAKAEPLTYVKPPPAFIGAMADLIIAELLRKRREKA